MPKGIARNPKVKSGKCRAAALRQWQNAEIRLKMINSGAARKGYLASIGKLNPEMIARRNISISRTAKKRWQDPEFKARAVKAVFEASQVQPNKAEQFLIDFFQANSLPFKYVGDGEFILGGKCPDFLNTDGRKQLIELFGTYWHEPSEVNPRIEYFQQYGFNTLIIWENELDNTEELLEKVKIFVEAKEEE